LEKIRGLALSHQGKFRHVDDLELHATLVDHYGYVLDSPFHPEPETQGADVERVRAGWVAVTPLHLDLTARAQWSHFDDWPLEKDPWKV
jgi:broad specificity polyphosphatase/5'/3'-nucleotidase SurE